MEEWQKWKNRTECTLDGSGYIRIVIDREYAQRLHNQNRVVFSQLSVATSGGTVFHLVKNFEDEKDRHAAWQALVEWFDGDILKAETANTVRNRLESYCLGNRYTALQYINQFLTAYRELNNIPGESISENHVLSIFLKGIANPNYATFVQIKRNKGGELNNTAIALRKEERDLIQKR
eukprot:4477292-Ditylum_brightwellii.AAC.1